MTKLILTLGAAYFGYRVYQATQMRVPLIYVFKHPLTPVKTIASLGI